MNMVATKEKQNTELSELKARLKSTWMAGDYDVFARYMEKDSEPFFQRLGSKPGTKLLDVACGAGQLALIAARAGLNVTGCDISTNWLEKARARAAEEELDIKFEEGDAESLPYGNGQFDAVISFVGAMFAPRPELVAGELTRVCRPGGIIAMANWTPEGFVGKMFKTIGKHIAPSGMPSPVLWGDEATVRQRFAENVSDLKAEKRIFHFDYPFSPEEVVDFFGANYGPMKRAFDSLDPSNQEVLRTELVELWRSNNKAVDGTTKVDAEYLEVIVTRGTNIRETNRNNGTQKQKVSRAESLGNRILEGAAALTEFVQTISDAEWNRPMSSSDSRTIGVVVHHVASMYPIELEVARTVADGTAAVDVTWDVVAGINAKHAKENDDVTKAEALELLQRNSRSAAIAVLKFTDDELDTAVAFGLANGAPVTAQFVLEDHALRHSWHHLAKIREALKR